jgi:imidazolonepropionase-like amidohydrolase
MRSIKVFALNFAWAALTLASSLASAQSAAAAPHDLVIKNATVMTVTHGNIKNGSIYIKGGKIAAVGEQVNAAADVAVIDAGGKYLTPGIVDSHSHIALDSDVNEATSPITPHMLMKDAFDYQDKAIYRALRGDHFAVAAWVGQHDRRAGDRHQAQKRRGPR